MVTSTIAKGRIASMDTRAAEQSARSAGDHDAHEHAEAAAEPGGRARAKRPTTRMLQLLQDDLVRYANQPIGVVVAETLEAAQEAARLVQVRYAAAKPEVNLEPRLAAQLCTREGRRRRRSRADAVAGDVNGGSAPGRSVKVEHVYGTPFETHNPMEPHATIAVWDGPDKLTLYDATQGIFGDQATRGDAARLAARQRARDLALPGRRLRQQRPTWSHVVWPRWPRAT